MTAQQRKQRLSEGLHSKVFCPLETTLAGSASALRHSAGNCPRVVRHGLVELSVTYQSVASFGKQRTITRVTKEAFTDSNIHIIAYKWTSNAICKVKPGSSSVVLCISAQYAMYDGPVSR